jgi:hypothetical protein
VLRPESRLALTLSLSLWERVRVRGYCFSHQNTKRSPS